MEKYTKMCISSLNPSGAMIMAAAPMYIALVPVTYVPCQLQSPSHISALKKILILNLPKSSYLTAPESICQSLVHAIIKLLPGITVRPFPFPSPKPPLLNSQTKGHIHNLRPRHPRSIYSLSLLDLWRLGCPVRRRPSHGSPRRLRQRAPTKTRAYA